MTKKNNSIPNENEDPKESVTEEIELEEVVPATGDDSDATEVGQEESLAKELAAAKEESRQNHERYLRAVADWENYRRRVAREKDELRQHAVSGLLEEFLPALDNLDLGLLSAANHPEAANVAHGFQMVADQIRGVLERHGVKAVDPAGEVFDPHQHESLSHMPHEEVPEGHVVQVVRKGYLLNDRLLRPASVMVSSGPPATDDKA